MTIRYDLKTSTLAGSQLTELVESTDGDFVKYDDYANAIDTINACLIAAGASPIIEIMQQQLSRTGSHPSDFIRAVVEPFLSLVSDWNASGRSGFSMPVIRSELILRIESILGHRVALPQHKRACQAKSSDDHNGQVSPAGPLLDSRLTCPQCDVPIESINELMRWEGV